MEQKVTIVLEGFPKIDPDTVWPLVNFPQETLERIRRGYYKWLAYQERKQAARIKQLNVRERPMEFELRVDNDRIMAALVSAESFSTRVEDRRDGTYIVINHEEQ